MSIIVTQALADLVTNLVECIQEDEAPDLSTIHLLAALMTAWATVCEEGKGE